MLSSIDLPVSAGEDFSDKHFLVVHTPATTGLGDIVLCAAANTVYAEKHGFIPVVDLCNYPNNYLEPGEEGKINAWEKFFYQPGGYSVQDIKCAKNILWAAKPRLDIHLESLDFLKVRKELQEETEYYCKNLFEKEKKYLGVLFRGTDYANRKPFRHFIQPSLKEMIGMAKRKKDEWKMDEIYLCTEVEEAILAFQEEFGNQVHFYPQKRYSSDCDQYLSSVRFERENDAYIRGSSYWILLNALSRCHCLVAGNCSGTNIALLLNKKRYEHTHIFQLGRYGIDDIS